MQDMLKFGCGNQFYQNLKKMGKPKNWEKNVFFFYELQIVFFGPIGHIFQPPGLFSP